MLFMAKNRWTWLKDLAGIDVLNQLHGSLSDQISLWRYHVVLLGQLPGESLYLLLLLSHGLFLRNYPSSRVVLVQGSLHTPLKVLAHTLSSVWERVGQTGEVILVSGSEDFVQVTVFAAELSLLFDGDFLQDILKHVVVVGLNAFLVSLSGAADLAFLLF